MTDVAVMTTDAEAMTTDAVVVMTDAEAMTTDAVVVMTDVVVMMTDAVVVMTDVVVMTTVMEVVTPGDINMFGVLIYIICTFFHFVQTRGIKGGQLKVFIEQIYCSAML